MGYDQSYFVDVEETDHTSVSTAKCTRMFDSFQIFADVSRPLVLNGTQGNEVYGGASSSAGIFLHRSNDDAVVKGGISRTYSTTYLVVS